MKKQKPLLSLEPEDQAAFEEQIQAFKSKQRAKSGLVPGVIFIGHIPHGFYEEEMMKYFSQFGEVLRVRLARSRKTGGSKGFAFVEFECDEVAKIAADTMNNYLMFEKILKCEFVPPERVKPGFFRGWRLGQPLAHAMNRKAQNKKKIRRVERNNWKRRLAKLEKLKEKLSSIGIHFDLPIEAAAPIPKAAAVEAQAEVRLLEMQEELQSLQEQRLELEKSQIQAQLDQQKLELLEKRDAHRKLPKMPLKSENPVPFREGMLLKGKRSIDKAIQVNMKNTSTNKDGGRAHSRSSSVGQREFYTPDKLEFWTNPKSPSKTPHGTLHLQKNITEIHQIQQDLETSAATEKSGLRKQLKSSQFENDFDVQRSNEKRKSSDSVRKNALQLWSHDGQYVSGTPGKFMLATAEDTALAARKFFTSGKTNDVPLRTQTKNMKQNRKSQDLNVTSEKPSFGNKRKSLQRENITDSVKKNASQSLEAAGRFASGIPGKVQLSTTDDFANFITFGKKKRKSRNGSLKIDDLSHLQPSAFCPDSNSTELFEDGARMKSKKGKRSDAVKTSTPMSAAGFLDTSGDDSSRYTLEIDTSENEITVRTPPKAIKKLKSKNKWQKQKKPLSFGKSPSNFSVSEIIQKSLNSSKGSNSGWKVSFK